MFWGLIMEPKRRYTQTVQKAFHVSKAALDLYNCNDEPSQLILTYNSRNYLLCTLQKDKILQCSLNLNFNVGDVICFATNGKCNVHLSGYLVEQEFEEDDEVSEDEEVLALAGTKRKSPTSTQQPKKKSKTEELLDQEYDSEDDTTFDLQEDEEDEDSADNDLEEEEEDNQDNEEEEEEDDDEEDEDGGSSLSEYEEAPVVTKSPVNGVSAKTTDKKSKKEEKKDKAAVKTETPNKTPKNNAKKENIEQAQTAQKRTLEGGITVQDLKVGEGAAVKSGKMVQVYYEGRLKSNNKMFDSHKQGPGFKFRVGKQEVIKGWDIGLLGMKVGGKRRISCPPQMAYGQKGSPPVIPPNATLIFEVELKNVQ